ncbi:hypothetical protein R3P38DRAFT_2852738 [Favolaschia claudopus]|uniref:Uncharacterized protein n=1 Tax=Favolaschia claudopus TaxID=2862362 RepID=A0AAW0DRA7_9AGAR
MCCLDHISAPALRRLILRFYPMRDGEFTWQEDSFTAFQLRSPDITVLDIGGDSESLYIPHQAFKNAFLHAPLLTSLSLERCHPLTFDEETIRALSYMPGGSNRV